MTARGGRHAELDSAPKILDQVQDDGVSIHTSITGTSAFALESITSMIKAFTSTLNILMSISNIHTSALKVYASMLDTRASISKAGTSMLETYSSVSNALNSI
jgi:hypothetical protein